MQFKDGEHLQSIVFENDEVIKVGSFCDSIIVRMESGQMSGVPWFEVWKNGQVISKWNAAKCDGVVYPTGGE